MNKRIKELAEQALIATTVSSGDVYRPKGYSTNVSKEFADKFAELIIRECMSKVSEWDMGIDDPVGATDNTSELSRDMVAEIKRHFKSK
jgi:hypothetical protein